MGPICRGAEGGQLARRAGLAGGTGASRAGWLAVSPSRRLAVARRLRSTRRPRRDQVGDCSDTSTSSACSNQHPALQRRLKPFKMRALFV